MDAVSFLHPTDETLSSYGLGKLDNKLAGAVYTHLEQCQDCRKRVAQISSDSFLERVRHAQTPSGRLTMGESLDVGTQSLKGANAPAPPAADTLPPGLADHPDYEIKRELGRGGMGVVYLAHNKLMGRDEVLKVMGRHIMERPGVLERFLREIRAVAKLRHPNIVTAYSAVRIGESIVFGMEYVEGLDLSRLVKSKGPMPVVHACFFAHQAALGLQHAHEKGMVHRDIKPHNLMLTHDGNRRIVKVLDFGLAKVTREEKVDGGLTAEGQALGTPDFIAPEQILDAPSADVRADIYSLGCTLYYLLSGHPPFKANSLYDMFQAHISRDADRLNLMRPEVPSELAALVAKMMAKDPARRFQTPGEVAKALEPFFKKGNVAFKGPEAEVSKAGQTNAGRSIAGALSTHTQSATDAGVPAVRAQKASEPTVPDGRRGGLIDFREPERPTDPTPAVAPTRRSPWLWPSAAAACIFGSIALGVITIAIKNQNGETKLTAPDDRSFKFEKDGVVVENKPSNGTTAGGTDGSPTIASAPGSPVVGKPPVPPAASAAVETVVGPKLSKSPFTGMEFVRIEAGSFVCGSPDDDPKAAAHEKPQHPVLITRPFYLCKYEVTQEEYQRVAGRNPSLFQGNPKNPVERVSWLDAVRFCNLLSEKEGLAPFYTIEFEAVRVPDWGRNGYRLPTSAEWEYACRAGTSTIFFVSAATMGEYAWFHQRGQDTTHPVGQLKPNPWGLYDMIGNVREWCWDYFDPVYYKIRVATDPKGPDTGTRRVRRGGAYDSFPRATRSAVLFMEAPTFFEQETGFRVARSAVGGTRGLSTSAAEAGNPLVGKPVAQPASAAPNGLREDNPIPQFLTLAPDVPKLAVEKGQMPQGPFWPPFIPDPSRSWRFGNPLEVRMNRKGLVIGASQGVNVLLTKAADYRKFTVSLALAASKGTEAYLAVHARPGPGGWEAVTARVVEKDGKVQAGRLATDFQDGETGNAANGLVTDKPFAVVIKADGQGDVQLVVGGKVTATLDARQRPAGAFGLFVKSGSLLVERLLVE